MPIFALISVLAMVFGIGVAVTFTQRLFRRLDRIESGRGSGALVDEVERLRIEVADLQTEVMRLEERLDFTEKLLGSGDDDGATTGI